MNPSYSVSFSDIDWENRTKSASSFLYDNKEAGLLSFVKPQQNFSLFLREVEIRNFEMCQYWRSKAIRWTASLKTNITNQELKNHLFENVCLFKSVEIFVVNLLIYSSFVIYPLHNVILFPRSPLIATDWYPPPPKFVSIWKINQWRFCQQFRKDIHKARK